MEEADKILELLKQGNKCGLELLFRRFYKPLTCYAVKFVAQQEEAEDIVQDVFIQFWENDRFNSIKNYLRSYLYQSVRNRCLNVLESKEKILLKPIDIVSEWPGSELFDELDYDRYMNSIYEEIDKLPDRTREIFKAVVLDGKRYKEVAEEFHISINTVKTVLTRSLTTLRTILDEKTFSILLLFVKIARE